MNLRNSKHLKDTGESYISHFNFGVKHGFILIKMGLMSIIHAFFPDVYPFELPRRVIILHEKIRRKHGEAILDTLTKEVREKYFK